MRSAIVAGTLPGTLGAQVGPGGAIIMCVQRSQIPSQGPPDTSGAPRLRMGMSPSAPVLETPEPVIIKRVL